jgi:hypothetical protein
MNIGSTNGGVAGRLSNFTPRVFTFDGVDCNSMEGLLQSFKFDKVHIQKEICKLTGRAAKSKGSKRNKAWKGAQTLWWDGIAYKRKSAEYQILLDRAYEALSKNSKFSKDLFLVPFFLYIKKKEMDKVKHYAISALFTLVLLNLIHIADFKLPWWVAPLAVFILGVLKEVVDKINPKKRLFDTKDILADSLGIMLVTSVYIFSFLLIKFV